MTPPRILAVVGMRAEARLLARVGIESVVGGGDAERLARRLDELLSPFLLKGGRVGDGGARNPLAGNAVEAESQRAVSLPGPDRQGRGHTPSPDPSPLEGEGRFSAVLSFGVAGGLSPELKAGDLVIATQVLAERETPYPADPAWAARLLAALPHARSGPLAGIAAPVVTAADKAELHAATGALAGDMESHIAAEAAARHALPFAAIRAISDPARRTLPRAAVAGFGTDGRADVGAVLHDLLRNPRQLPALIRTGAEAGRAFGALRRIAGAIKAR